MIPNTFPFWWGDNLLICFIISVLLKCITNGSAAAIGRLLEPMVGCFNPCNRTTQLLRFYYLL
jgi:hypothetical protein